MPPAQATPLSAGSAIVAAEILLETQLFIFAPLFVRIRPVWPTAIEPHSTKARYEKADENVPKFAEKLLKLASCLSRCMDAPATADVFLFEAFRFDRRAGVLFR